MSDAEIKSIARELHRLVKLDIEKHMSEIKAIITKDMDEPMSVKTASLRYKLSQSNIRARIAAGEIPYKKVGSKYILSRNQLDKIFFDSK